LKAPNVHLIGHLQTNKARSAAAVPAHPVRRLAASGRAHRPHRTSQPVLVEVNISREPQKSGVAPEETVARAIEIANNSTSKGLMAMVRRMAIQQQLSKSSGACATTRNNR